MRLNRLQAIHKNTYADEAAFYEKLYLAQGIAVCLAAPTPAPKPKKKSQFLRFLESISGIHGKRTLEKRPAPATPAPLNPTQQYLQRLDDIPDEAYLQSITRAADEDAPAKIGLHAFEGCTGLTELSLPNSLTAIGAEAFRSTSAAEGFFTYSCFSDHSSCLASSQKATAPAAATLRESTPWAIGIFTV